MKTTISPIVGSGRTHDTADSRATKPSIANWRLGGAFKRGLTLAGHAWLLCTAKSALSPAAALRLPAAFGPLEEAARPQHQYGRKTLEWRQLDRNATVCPRRPQGTVVQPPPERGSENGYLEVDLSFQSALDENGNPKFCYVLPTGEPSPLLRVHPGDTLLLRLRNDVGLTYGATPQVTSPAHHVTCGNLPKPTKDATNVHFHGMTVSPMCPEDNVLHVTVNRGDDFLYEVAVPHSAAPGLYWYHPHQHGLAELQVQGGASAPIIVEGIETMQPLVGGLPEQLLVIRDQPLAASLANAPNAPAWDVSVNNIPVRFTPNQPFQPAVLRVAPGERMFCRLVNAAADTILDVAMMTDGKLQPIGLVALDGYILRESKNGKVRPLVRDVEHVLIPPASRAEFIVTAPKALTDAMLVTRNVDTGPDGDNDPNRPLVKFDLSTKATHNGHFIPMPTHVQALPSVTDTPPVTKTRTLYFSENNPESKFYITEVGSTPTLFAANNSPAIVVRQETVEDWIIENRSLENHEFHLHQLHFTLMEDNGKTVSKQERQALDTVNIGFWNGTGSYPSIKVRVDFRGADVGKFVYHCHILEHEDDGMMATIEVEPAASHG